MLRSIVGAYCIALGFFLPSSTLAQVTPEDVQEMPLPDLAKLVLGEVGALMIDVDRPSWGERNWRIPSSIPWPPKEAPPVHRLRFFGKGVVTGSQFGMCGSDWVTVKFDEHGVVEAVEAERRYGVEGNLYSRPGSWTYEESEKICDGVTSTRSYFPAPGAQSALEIARYLDAIGGKGPFAGQSFEFHCTGACREGREDLRRLALDEIDESREIDCLPSASALPSCFELILGVGKVGPYPAKFRVYGSNYMNRVVVDAIHVEVGSTLE